MDCVRTVMRMGAETSIMTYRRTIQEIPVEELELEEAEIEGVEIMYLVTPTEVIGENGKVVGLKCQKNRTRRAGQAGSPPAGTDRRVPSSSFPAT